MMKRIYAIFIICALFLSAIMPTAIAEPLSTSVLKETKIPAGFNLVKNDTDTALYVNPDTPSILVQDKRNGRLWSSEVLSSEYDQYNTTSNLILEKMKSLMVVSFVNDANESYPDSPSASQATHKTMRRIENGVQFTIEFIGGTGQGPNIEVVMEVTLSDNILTVRIPGNKIVEKGQNRLINIQLLPYFGYASNQNKGYFVIPDGSGAIYNFKQGSASDLGTQAVQYRLYGRREVDTDEEFWGSSPIFYTQEGVLVPLHGVKKEDSALGCAIVKGDQEAGYQFKPSGTETSLNSLYPFFNYRYPLRQNKNKLQYEPNINIVDREVKYFFLDGDEANYSGIAKAYREYLLKTGGIADRIAGGQDIPVNIEFFMGITEKKALYTEFIQMTTFPQAKIMLQKLLDDGVKNAMLNFQGWNRNGAMSQPYHFPIAGQVGGESAAKDFFKFAKENNIQAGLTDDFVFALEENADGFVKRTDLVYSRTGFMENSIKPNAFPKNFMITPRQSEEKFYDELYEPKAKEYGVGGTYFQMLGVRLFPDFKEGAITWRDQSAQYYRNMLKKSRENLGFASVEGGNAYVWPDATFLNKIPTSDKGFTIMDATIPLYQLVTHGFIPYSSTPGNLTGDYQKTKLKWVEYGIVPHFKLTDQRSDQLRNTWFESLFSTRFVDYEQKIVDTYKEFNAKLKDTYDQTITSHEQIAPDVYRVIYQNGVKVYVNYSDAAYTITDKISVPAMDYIVLEQGGNQR